MVTHIQLSTSWQEVTAVEIETERYRRDDDGVLAHSKVVITADLTRAEAKQLRALLDTIERRVMAVYGGPNAPAPQDE